MVSKTVDVGARGEWQIIVTQESQDLDANTSRVRVRGVAHNNGTATSFDDSIGVSIRGYNTWNGNVSLNVPAGSSRTLIDKTFTATHGPDGYKTISYTVNMGDTGTTTFGGGGSVSVSITLDRIAQVPDRVGTPSLRFDAPQEVNVAWGAPNNNGASLDNFEIEVDNANTFASPSSRFTNSGSARSIAIGGLTIGTTRWFRVRAHNSRGWGPWSPIVSFKIPDVPAKVATPTLTLRPPDDILVDWTAPDDSGADINGYQVQADNNSDFSSPTTVGVASATSYSWITTSFGQTLWFRVRARNSQGWGPWSTARSILIVSGPRVNVGGVWRNTVAYVNVGGVWRVAVPYVNVGGVWKIAGG